MAGIQEPDIRTILQRIPDKMWENSLKHGRKAAIKVAAKSWIHNRFYLCNPPNDGSKPQVIKGFGISEVPYRRSLFHASPRGRYGLGTKIPVAYFSEDFLVNCCEMVPALRNDPELKYRTVLQYMHGKSRLHDAYGYPLTEVKIASDCRLLNLASANNDLVYWLVDNGPWQDRNHFLASFLRSRNEEVKTMTHILATRAYQAGCEGILYSSVRVPVDVACPDWNLVLFSERCIADSGLLPEADEHGH